MKKVEELYIFTGFYGTRLASVYIPIYTRVQNKALA